MPQYQDSYVYVVTRDGRRVSENNFPMRQSAEAESELWLRVKAKWDPCTKVAVVKTDDPRSIR